MDLSVLVLSSGENKVTVGVWHFLFTQKALAKIDLKTLSERKKVEDFLKFAFLMFRASVKAVFSLMGIPSIRVFFIIVNFGTHENFHNSVPLHYQNSLLF